MRVNNYQKKGCWCSLWFPERESPNDARLSFITHQKDDLPTIGLCLNATMPAIMPVRRLAIVSNMTDRKC